MKLLKKIYCLLLSWALLAATTLSFGLSDWQPNNNLHEYNDNDIANLTAQSDWSISDWTRVISEQTEGIIKPSEQIKDHETALSHTVQLVQIAINLLF